MKAVIFFRISSKEQKELYSTDAQTAKANDIINLNQHKIQHSDSIFLDYGNEDKIVRVFLYINFMIKIITGMQNALSQQSDLVMEVAE